MTVLLLADHNHNIITTATLSAATAAAQLGEIHILVAGKNCAAAAQHAAKIAGVSIVLHAEHDAYGWPLAENIAPLVAQLAPSYSHVIAPATSTGKDILPRAAALLDMSQISDVIQILAPDTFMRPVYAGNALETVQSSDKIILLTVRQTAFAPAAQTGSATAKTITPPTPVGPASFVSIDENVSARPELTSARIVVSGGRGIGSAENFKILEAFADSLGAGIGASRAAVDAGFVPNDYQVGQTGKVVAPDLYIAVGISGAIQHLAGMKDSKVIVAINKDENAPIFAIADYGLVADWQSALPQLQQLLAKE